MSQFPFNGRNSKVDGSNRISKNHCYALLRLVFLMICDLKSFQEFQWYCKKETSKMILKLKKSSSSGTPRAGEESDSSSSGSLCDIPSVPSAGDGRSESPGSALPPAMARAALQVTAALTLTCTGELQDTSAAEWMLGQIYHPHKLCVVLK